MAPRRAVLRDELITLAHGAGGKATRDLVEALFVEELGNDVLAALEDAVPTLPVLGVPVTRGSQADTAPEPAGAFRRAMHRVAEALAGLSGSLTKLSDGTSYLIAGTGTEITTGSSGAVTVGVSPSYITSLIWIVG